MDRSLASGLSGSFVIANLGAGGDADYRLPPAFLRTITLLEADAGRQPIATTEQYHKKYTIREIVAGDKSPRTFTLRKYWGCSSLYEPRQDMIRQYGMQAYFEAESSRDVVPVTLSEILQAQGLDSIDYLKTDLEGVDFEVIKSCESFLDRILAIKCELRFQPVYYGEPFFHEVTDFLLRRDFELIGLKPYYWKALTSHRKDHRDGRIAFADCLFFKKPEALRRWAGERAALAAVKQVIIAVISNKKSHAEWLIEQFPDILPPAWREAITPLVIPRPLHGNAGKLKEEMGLLAAKIARHLRAAMRRPAQDRRFDDAFVARGE